MSRREPRTAAQAEIAELRRVLTRLVAAAPPFTVVSIGAPHSLARVKQLEHLDAHADAREVLASPTCAQPLLDAVAEAADVLEWYSPSPSAQSLDRARTALEALDPWARP